MLSFKWKFQIHVETYNVDKIFVSSCLLIRCVCGDTIQTEVVVLCFTLINYIILTV